MPQRHCRLHLKGGGVGLSLLYELPADFPHHRHFPADFLFADRPFACLDFLSVLKNCRRYIPACAITCLPENLRKKSGHRTLSVGTCNMDKAKLLLRVSKLLHEIFHIFKARPDTVPSQLFHISHDLLLRHHRLFFFLLHYTLPTAVHRRFQNHV